MNRLVLLTVLAAVLTTGLLVTVPSGTDPSNFERKNAQWADQEQARLEKALLHAEPGSDRAVKAQLKLDRLEAWRLDQPQPGFPDQFAQVLYDMRVPSDRTFPEYQPGYRFRELDKARQNVRYADKTLVWNQRGPGNVAGAPACSSSIPLIRRAAPGTSPASAAGSGKRRTRAPLGAS